nr:aminotransferase class V-fold PLP-dependent enzyme [Serratia marcescens]
MTFTPELARAQFSALSQQIDGKPAIFFDGPGGAQVSRGVLEKMTDYLGRYNANLGGHYFSSRVTGEVMGQARESVRALLNAPSPDNIVFGMNMTTLTFHLSRIISRDWQAGDEVIVTALDHYANVSSWQQAAADKGAAVHQIPLESADCALDAAKVCERINANTRLVAVSYASNVTGSIVDIKTIVEAAHRVGAQVYVDAVHYAPHNLIDVQALGCDFLVCSAYKFFGPHVGMAYIAPQWLQPAPLQGRAGHRRRPRPFRDRHAKLRSAGRRRGRYRVSGAVGHARCAVKAASAGELRRLPPA